MDKSKLMMVVALKPDDYDLFDGRCHKPFYATDEDGEAVFQYIDEIEFKNSKSSKINIEFFSPNPVGLLLHMHHISKNKTEKMFDDISKLINVADYSRGTSKLKSFTKQIYEYINEFQKTIIFGYTAIETFINLSIPNEYSYTSSDNKGIKNVYDKKAIERWISCSSKISDILVDVYGTPIITNKQIWTFFKSFEVFRNEIIHLKTEETEYYRKYFKRNNLKILNIPVDIIKYFFEKRIDKEKTNPMWPWIINTKNDFPTLKNYDSNKFTIVGNVHEGIVNDA